MLDEADSMTAAAQFSLRRSKDFSIYRVLIRIVMEKYAKNTRFCLICNYVSKVIPALQSRCTRFKFRPIPMDEAKVRVREICDAER